MTNGAASLPELTELRWERWCQTPDRRLAGPDVAVDFIERVGIATLFPASPEVPNLFHAYMGDPEAATDSGHDTPSGQVYAWRWDLGRREAAFYTAIVRKRPTWVRWSLLPAVLRLRATLDDPEDLYAAGGLSSDARRVVQALEEAGGTLSTGELRRVAGFPTGKAERAAYLKAVAELDSRLMLAKVFSQDDLDMSHALVRSRYPEQVEAAQRMSRDEAYEQVLRAYGPSAVYVLPTPLARHLGVPEPELRAALERLEGDGLVRSASFEGQRGPVYLWAS